MNSRIWGKQLFSVRRAVSGEDSCVRKGQIMMESTRSKRKFNNPVSFDEKRPSRAPRGTPALVATRTEQRLLMTFKDSL